MSQTNNPNDLETGGSSAFKKAANEAGKMAVKKASKALSTKAVAAAGSSIGTPIIIGMVIVVFVLLGMVMAFIVLSSAGEQRAKPEKGYSGGEISDFGVNEIPSQYIPIYKAAQE